MNNTNKNSIAISQPDRLLSSIPGADCYSVQPAFCPSHMLGAGYHYSTFQILICCLLSFHTVAMYIMFFIRSASNVSFVALIGSLLIIPTRENDFLQMHT